MLISLWTQLFMNALNKTSGAEKKPVSRYRIAKAYRQFRIGVLRNVKDVFLQVLDLKDFCSPMVSSTAEQPEYLCCWRTSAAFRFLF
jgi:hypothetical protein